MRTHCCGCSIAGLVYRVFCVTKPGLPVRAYDDVSDFKIYVCDVGLMWAMAQLFADVLGSESPAFVEFRGGRYGRECGVAVFGCEF